MKTKGKSKKAKVKSKKLKKKDANFELIKSQHENRSIKR
jgi:hypothetical protein